MSLLKKLIAPVQAKILEKGMCPGCTNKLANQKKREPITTETELIFCECGRVYVYNRVQRKYRRALPEELSRRF